MRFKDDTTDYIRYTCPQLEKTMEDLKNILLSALSDGTLSDGVISDEVYGAQQEIKTLITIPFRVALEKAINDLRYEINDRDDTISNLESSNSDQENTIDDLKYEKRDLESRIEELESEVEELQARIKELEQGGNDGNS